jgi:hypothetical protein
MLKNLADSGAALGHATYRLEGRVVVAWCTASHYDGVTPVGPDEPDHLWACSISFQNHDEVIPDHRVEGFPDVEEDPVEGLQLEV